MQDKLFFEYAVLRLVPRVEREEFINAGVVLYCPKQKFLQCRYELNENRIKAICPGADIEDMRKLLYAFQQVCNGNHDAGPIAQLPMPGRFRWLTATRSTILQTSKVHTGLCTDASIAIGHIFRQQVELC
jgi:hypothetical protein